MTRPHHHRIGLAGQIHVVGIPAPALHQHGVLGAGHRLANGEFLHRPGIGIFKDIHGVWLESGDGALMREAPFAAHKQDREIWLAAVKGKRAGHCS
jgi:hypothetical protein